MTIACIISFIVGALMMMCAIVLMSYQKDKKLRNKVHFFVEKHIGWFALVIDGKKGSRTCVCSDGVFYRFGLTPADFTDMEVGEKREVFLNLED